MSGGAGALSSRRTPPPGVGAIYRWYVVSLLLLVFILSYFDRYALTLLVEPIKASMKLDDFQIGLLLGPAFSLFNVVVSIPLGWYADSANRRFLLISGIIVWCAMTVGCGFASTFTLLLIGRLGLGIGEAVVSPSSLSIISDYFDRNHRARAVSVYMAGPYLGAGLAFLGGGLLVNWLDQRGHLMWPLFGSLAPWQAAFMLVGAPGFVIAALMLTLREPPRHERLQQAGGSARALRYMAVRWRSFGGLFVGSSCNSALSGLVFWNIPLFHRVWGWNVAEVGAVTGIFYFTAGPLGTAVAVLAQRHFERRHADGPMRVLLLGILLAVPASALYPVMPSPEIAVMFMFVAFIGKSVATAGGPSSIVLITPGEIRGQSLAIYNATITLIGTALGPPLIGWAIDRTGDPRAIGIVLFCYCLVVGIPSTALVWRGLREFRTGVLTFETHLAKQQGC